ncbi:hypothetical protein B0O99DRAFT_687457 [Bisporella sp. PMI_857]|nr:hypothetical protein B0O99DRAFT_687457 [Bisporella sp. PMI_857]
MKSIQCFVVYSLLFAFSSADDKVKCSPATAVLVESFISQNGGSNGRGLSSLDISLLGQGSMNAGIKAIERDDTDLECTTAEACYSLQGVPFCYNILTGYFHLLTASGNAITGDYTLSNGQRGNLYNGPNPGRSGSSLAVNGNDENPGDTGGHTGGRSSTFSTPQTATRCSGSGRHGGHCGDDDHVTSRTTIATPSTQAIVTSGVLTLTSGTLTITLPVPDVAATTTQGLGGPSTTSTGSTTTRSTGPGEQIRFPGSAAIILATFVALMY